MFFIFPIDFDLEGSGLKGLRSELSSVIEHSRKGDIKQLELEHTITRLQEEISVKTTQLLELGERLDNKTQLSENLKSKLEQKNLKLMAQQKELTKKDQTYEKMEEEVNTLISGDD